MKKYIDDWVENQKEAKGKLSTKGTMATNQTMTFVNHLISLMFYVFQMKMIHGGRI